MTALHIPVGHRSPLSQSLGMQGDLEEVQAHRRKLAEFSLPWLYGHILKDLFRLVSNNVTAKLWSTKVQLMDSPLKLYLNIVNPLAEEFV
eukprot:CAMPEP_0172831174 /NCGR_PEP_ID=MMETSP1075-20121228/22790_1 /TAXON_ID=2916 /ORGANISM="Ceratium fusus, Strain PA161109" /LENGTH=89 /DNA_ID=CAMNT_0013673597 /DNA_START=395 /DNA_END=661 /DNA_ORIENTATION=-